MIQIIITIGIIIAAVVAVIILAVRKVRGLKKDDPCSNCSADCGDCAAKDLHKKKKSGKGTSDCGH